MIKSEALDPHRPNRMSYYVECNRCCVRAPGMFMEADQAAESAYRRGWDTRRVKPMWEPLDWLCPHCLEQEAEAAKAAGAVA